MANENPDQFFVTVADTQNALICLESILNSMASVERPRVKRLGVVKDGENANNTIHMMRIFFDDIDSEQVIRIAATVTLWGYLFPLTTYKLSHAFVEKTVYPLTNTAAYNDNRMLNMRIYFTKERALSAFSTTKKLCGYVQNIIDLTKSMAQAMHIRNFWPLLEYLEACLKLLEGGYNIDYYINEYHKSLSMGIEEAGGFIEYTVQNLMFTMLNSLKTNVVVEKKHDH